jgi:homoserine kinase
VSGIKVFAPASIGNLGIGFDIIGLALEKPGDEVIARKSNTPGVRITKITQ